MGVFSDARLRPVIIPYLQSLFDPCTQAFSNGNKRFEGRKKGKGSRIFMRILEAGNRLGKFEYHSRLIRLASFCRTCLLFYFGEGRKEEESML